ncbi:MAG: hypothetical protein R3C99_25320 [Pirellulaceae bacterium]
MKSHFHTSSGLLMTLMALGLLVGPSVATAQSREDSDSGNSRQRNNQTYDYQNEYQQDNQRNQDQQDRRESSQQDSRDRYDSQSQRDQFDSRSQRSRDSQSGSQNRQSGNRQIQLEPQGWVTVATDMNNDGKFDKVETIYLYDLQIAQQRSQARARAQADSQRQDHGQTQGQRQMAQRQMTQRQRAGQGGSSRNQWTNRDDDGGSARGSVHRLEGQLKDINQIRLTDSDKQQTIARLKVRDGRTARIFLGDKSQLSSLNLQDGDNITIIGVPGRVNDRWMLVARKITANGESISLNQQQQQQSNAGLKRVSGQITDTRKAKFRGHDEQFMVVQIQTDQGDSVIANLGPVSRLESLDLQNGDAVTVLARQGSVNGETAWIAEQVRANERTAMIPHPNDTQRYRSQQR